MGLVGLLGAGAIAATRKNRYRVPNFLLCLLAGQVALAVPPAITIEFDGSGEGKVTFRGKQHTGPGMHCSDCHFELFDVSRSSRITRADHRARQACFVCHDRKRACASRCNCDRCHVEPEVESVADVTLQAAPGPPSGPKPSPSGDKP